VRALIDPGPLERVGRPGGAPHRASWACRDEASRSGTAPRSPSMTWRSASSRARSPAS